MELLIRLPRFVLLPDFVHCVQEVEQVLDVIRKLELQKLGLALLGHCYRWEADMHAVKEVAGITEYRGKVRGLVAAGRLPAESVSHDFSEKREVGAVAEERDTSLSAKQVEDQRPDVEEELGVDRELLDVFRSLGGCE